MRKFVLFLFLVCVSGASLGCTDDESVPPNIEHTMLTLHVRFTADRSYGGWAFTQSAMPNVFGHVAVLPTTFSGSQRHELPGCRTSYQRRSCEWSTMLVVTNDVREIEIYLDEHYAWRGTIFTTRIPLDEHPEQLFVPHDLPARGGTVRLWAELR